MKLSSFAIFAGASTAVAFLSASPVKAQQVDPIVINFHVPETVDPNKKIYLDGTTNTFTATGADLVNSNYPSQLGVELHSVAPGTGDGFIKDITSFSITFNWAGNVTIDSQANGSYSPWTYTGGLVGDSNTLYTYTFTMPDNSSAPINDNFDPFANSYLTNYNPYLPTQSFATVTVSGSNDTTTAFASQNTGQSIVFQGQSLGQDRSSVPEPGAIALIVGSAALGGLALNRRRITFKNQIR